MGCFSIIGKQSPSLDQIQKCTVMQGMASEADGAVVTPFKVVLELLLNGIRARSNERTTGKKTEKDCILFGIDREWKSADQVPGVLDKIVEIEEPETQRVSEFPTTVIEPYCGTIAVAVIGIGRQPIPP